MINARAVGNVVKLIGATCAVVILTVEGATVVWRAPAHVAKVVPDRSCTEVDARHIWRGLEVLVHPIRLSAVGRRARAARARILLDVEVDAGTLRPCGIDVSEAATIRRSMRGGARNGCCTRQPLKKVLA